MESKSNWLIPVSLWILEWFVLSVLTTQLLEGLSSRHQLRYRVSWHNWENKKHNLTLQNAGVLSDSLAIWIQQVDKLRFKFTQLRLIEKFFYTKYLWEGGNRCKAPATTDPLNVDLDGSVFKEDWNYDLMLGMMMYLANNTCPNISYAVHQAARFTHQPWHSHAVGVKWVARYLKQAKHVCPQMSLIVDCYVDADCVGSFSIANKQDPVSVKSLTGYVIMHWGALYFGHLRCKRKMPSVQ